MEETKKLSCIDCNVKKCNAKQNIENNKPYPGFCVSHNMDLKDRQRALDTYLGDEKDLKIMRASARSSTIFTARQPVWRRRSAGQKNWVPRRSELQAVWDS